MEEKLACNYMSYLLNSTTPKSNKHIYILKPDSYYILILERLFAKNKNRKQYVTFKSQTTTLVFFSFFPFY